jgi:hypothetical protein
VALGINTSVTLRGAFSFLNRKRGFFPGNSCRRLSILHPQNKDINMRRFPSVCLLLALMCLAGTASAFAQSTTTGSIVGKVTTTTGAPVSGASVIAVHVPSGTNYGALTRTDGRYTIPGMRVGPGYRVTVTHIGYNAAPQENITVSLGVPATVDFVAREQAVSVAGIEVSAERSPILNAERTGAATTVTREALASLPTISGRIESVARMTPQYGGNMSFAGQDGRLNNITVDGSYFNNSFGLGSTPGERTGVAPISLSAIEQIQINVAPYDVRQGHFVGAAVNTVTRSGTNEVRGSGYYSFRNQDFYGTQAGANTVDPGTFKYYNVGGWLSGPIIKNKLFFFANYEHDPLVGPGTTFRANAGGEPVAGNVTRVKASDLDALSSFLQTKFQFDPGSYQGYNFETPATRALVKLDYNISDRSKLSVRYNHLDSNTDVLLSNSSSLGFGSRRTSVNGLNFSGSNYKILENIRSGVAELNSMIGKNKSNNIIFGYTYQDESRGGITKLFPFVDILDNNQVYTSFGSEPFTPNNELRYSTWQLQDNFTVFGDKHTWTFGVSGEKYHSENVFFPGSQSVYVYNSLADWYTDANDYLANPNRTVSPVTLNRFQVRWNNIPGMDKPTQPLDVFYAGAYVQDEVRVTDKFKLTAGMRLDIPWFGDTGFDNPAANNLVFKDENDQLVKYNTKKLPDPKLQFSPRIGFNYDAAGDRSTQVRGGTGIFTGPPIYVWISNQIGNTGVLTGFEDNRSPLRTRPFHPDPNHYKPTNITGSPASSYELALTDEDFRFPQIWRSDIALDQKLPLGFIATVEGIYNRDINGIYYINANLAAPNAFFTGPDHRPRWTTQAASRINQNVQNATVLKNQNVGRSWHASASVEKTFSNGFFAKAGYGYGEAKNTIDPGSIASGSWTNNQHPGNPNNPGLGFSSSSPGHRLFGMASKRAEWFKFGATTVSVFAESFTNGNLSYSVSGDLNGDGGSSNDLIYVQTSPTDGSTNFLQYTQAASGSVPARTFTAAEQSAAWEAYIAQDPYLSEHRGEYAQRGAVFLPAVTRFDVSVAQELFTNVYGKRNAIQVRADILNAGNLINKDWGIATRIVSNQPLLTGSPVANATTGAPQYRLRNVSNGTEFKLMDHTYEKSASLSDVYKFQFSVRYTFN